MSNLPTIIPAFDPTRPVGERERIAYRQRMVFLWKRDGVSLDDLTDKWNAHCIEMGRPDECRARKTIAQDIRDVLERLARDTKVDASAYRELLAARIEEAISTDHFRNRIRAGDTAYIDRLLKSVQQLSQMYGANAPTKIAQTDSAGNDVPTNLSDDERIRLINELMEKARLQKAASEDEEES